MLSVHVHDGHSLLAFGTGEKLWAAQLFSSGALAPTPSLLLGNPGEDPYSPRFTLATDRKSHTLVVYPASVDKPAPGGPTFTWLAARVLTSDAVSEELPPRDAGSDGAPPPPSPPPPPPPPPVDAGTSDAPIERDASAALRTPPATPTESPETNGTGKTPFRVDAKPTNEGCAVAATGTGHAASTPWLALVLAGLVLGVARRSKGMGQTRSDLPAALRDAPIAALEADPEDRTSATEQLRW